MLADTVLRSLVKSRSSHWRSMADVVGIDVGAVRPSLGADGARRYTGLSSQKRDSLTADCEGLKSKSPNNVGSPISECDEEAVVRPGALCLDSPL